MQEIDIIRVMIYGCFFMISIVTIAKQFRLEGIFGTSNRYISFGIFFISSSLLSQAIFTTIEYEDPIWNPMIHIALLILFVIGICLIFYGLWKISIFFDELKTAAKKTILSVPLADESK